MTYTFQALPKFEREFKKFFPKQQEVVRGELKKIQEDPFIGERKKGALSMVWVHKFKVRHQLYLLAYRVAEEKKEIYLYALATHENFYKELQKYLQ
jgi:mRNA-degrading endonuclease RelE of RelBE toxin-antitoxin system